MWIIKENITTNKNLKLLGLSIDYEIPTIPLICQNYQKNLKRRLLWILTQSTSFSGLIHY